MKEWILENTVVTEEKYDILINPNMLNMKNSNIEKEEVKYKLFCNHPIIVINNFTYKKPSKLRCILYGIKKDKKYFIHKNVKFRILAETIVSDKKNKFYEELYSKQRMGTCFLKSENMCFNLKNSQIVTAICINPATKSLKKFLHCFVLTLGKDGKEYVLDGTLNVVIDKETYLNLFNAKIISKIEREKMIKDEEFIKSKNLDELMSFAEYLCFPDEVMEGVKKYIKTK